MRTEAVKVGTDVYHRSTETLAGHSRVLADTDNHLATRLREVEIQLKRVSADLAAFKNTLTMKDVAAKCTKAISSRVQTTSIAGFDSKITIRDEGPGVL